MSERNITNKDRLIAGGMTTLIGMAAIGDAAVDHDLINIQSHSLQLLSQDNLTHLDPITITSSSEINSPIQKSSITIKVKPNAVATIINHKSEILLPPTNLEPLSSASNATIEQLQPLDLTNLTVPSEVKKIMDKNATFTYLGSELCSGFLVRDKNDVPMGEVFAAHCLTPPDQRIMGADGKIYLPETQNVTVYTGSAFGQLQQVGIIDKILMPPADSEGTFNKDLVVGSFIGKNINKVIQAYRQTKLKVSEIKQIKTGDIVYTSGWPAFQPNNPGQERKQDLAMKVIGSGLAKETFTGRTINALYLAIAKNADGTDCKPGLSGAQAFTYEGGEYKSIGVMSMAANLMPNNGTTQQQADDNRQAYEKITHFDLSQASAVCLAGYDMTTLARGASIENISSSYESIPGYVDGLIQKAHNEFFDPNYVKTWVRGAINLDPNGKGNWKMNPLIFYDNKSGGAVIVSYTDNSKDGLELDYLPDFKDQKFNGDPALFNESGVIDVFTNQNNTNGFINASGGQIFGQNIQNDPNTIEFIQNDPAFSIYYDNSTQSLQITQYKHN